MLFSSKTILTLLAGLATLTFSVDPVQAQVEAQGTVKYAGHKVVRLKLKNEFQVSLVKDILKVSPELLTQGHQ
jgi:uncharacterized membrane protein